MAGLHFTSGVDKGFENDLNRMNKEINNFSSNVVKQNGIVSNSYKEIGATIGGVLSIAALAKAGKEIITFSNDLQNSLTEVATVSSEVTNNFDQYKQALLDMSNQSQSSAIQLSNAFYDIVSAGLDGANGLELLAIAEKASTAGFVDVGIAASGITTVLNAWGLSTSEAGKVSDVFFKAVEKGTTTFPELGTNIAKVAPLAASMGVSFEEVSGAIATVTKQGTQTPEALTQIRAAMVAMNEVLGDGWSASMSFQEGLQEIANKAGGSQNELKRLLGTDEAVLAVLAMTGKNAQMAASDLDAMNNSVGATNAAFEKVSNTATMQGQMLVNNLLSAFEPMGAEIVGTFASLAKSLNEAFESGDIKTYAEVLGTIIAAFAAWKVSIATTAAFNSAFGKKALAQALQEQKDKLKAIKLEIQKQQELIKTATIVAQTAKAEISAINYKIQAQRNALSQAIANKNLTAARAAQQEIANLKDQQAAAIITKKTATEQISGAVTKTNTLQTELHTNAIKKGTAASNVMTIASSKLGGAFKSLKAAFASNPIGILVTGLTLAVPLIMKFANSQSQLVKETGKLNGEIQKEQTEANNLFEALKKTNPKSEERAEILKKLNDKYPDLLKYYNLDVAGLNEIEKAQGAVNRKIVETIALRSQEERILAAGDKLYEKQTNILNGYLNVFEGIAEKGVLTAAFSKINSELQKEGANTVEIAKQIAKEIGVEIAAGKTQREATSVGTGVVMKDVYKTSKYEDLLRFVELLNKESKDYLKTQKEIEDFTKAFVGASVSDVGKTQTDAEIAAAKKAAADKAAANKAAVSDNDKQQKAALSALEIANQQEINKITQNWGNKEGLEKEFGKKMLEQRLSYLAQLQILTTDKLEKLRIEEEKINTKAQLDNVDNNSAEINELLKQYQSYAQKRAALIKEANAKIAKLQGVEGSKDAIKQIQDELTKSLSGLDIKNIEETTGISKLFENTKDKGIEEIQKLVDGTKSLLDSLDNGVYKENIFGIDENTFKLLAKQPELIEKIKKALGELESNDNLNSGFDESIDLLTNINQLASDLTENLGEGTDQASILAKGFVDAASSTVGLVQSIKAVGEAVGALETASGILAAISAAVKVIGAVDSALKEAEEQRTQNYIAQLKLNHAINLELIDQVALYKEGNELFSSDNWGTALSGLTAYNDALEYQNEILTNIATSDQSKNIDSSGIWKFVGFATAITDTLRQSVEKGAIDSIQSTAENYKTLLQQALSNVVVKTKDRSGFANLLGASDKYKSLLSIYPDLIDANGELNTSILETVISTANLTDANKEMLQELLDATTKAQESYNQFGDYISSIFGNVSDDVSQSFQDMYESGTDAMSSLQDSFSDMIESFTRDAITFAYLQPLTEELNTITKSLGVDYAKGNISVDELSTGIISSLGDFYNSLNALQPSILQAYADADELAAAAGFDSAFSGDSSDSLDKATTSISESITEQTGTEIKGRINAIMLSNQIISENSSDMLRFAIQNSVTLNKIKENTDYLPQIAKYTKQTADKL
jgi:hypothetical protein